LTATFLHTTISYEDIHDISRNREAAVRACFRGLDLDSPVEKPSRLLATGRTARVTYVAHGWKVTDPATRADIGSVPERALLVEIQEDVLRMYVRRHQQQEER